jgi:hypothetical protein
MRPAEDFFVSVTKPFNYVGGIGARCTKGVKIESVSFFLGGKKCSDLNFPHFFVN